MYSFSCINPDCRLETGAMYVFMSKQPVCDKCGNKPPDVTPTSIIHLGYYDKKGNLKGFQGQKISIACGRKASADPWNGMSGNARLVNCPLCKKTDIFKEKWYPNLEEVNAFKDAPE
jgi:hypothetical protein